MFKSFSVKVEVLHVIFVALLVFLLYISNKCVFVAKQNRVVFVNKLAKLDDACRGVDSRLIVVGLPPELCLNSEVILCLKVILQDIRYNRGFLKNSTCFKPFVSY